MALVYPDTLPRIYIPASRSCVGEGDINCFSSIQGCDFFDARSNLTDRIFTDYFRCNETDWSVSLTFAGTGIELGWVANCTSATCEWSVDGKGCGWERFPHTGSMLDIPRLPGDGDDAKHTLVVSSIEADYPTILEVRHATVYAGLNTPVGPEDHIWIPATSSQLKYDSGMWERDNDPTIPPDSRTLRLGDGNGTVSTEIFADSFQFHTLEGLPGGVVSETQRANRTVFFDGATEGEPYSGDVELSSGGWHNVSIDITRLTDEGNFWFLGLSYHPAADNVTRIRHVTPPALIDAVESEDFTEWTTDVQCEALFATDDDGGVAGLPPPVGAVALFATIFVSYLCRV